MCPMIRKYISTYLCCFLLFSGFFPPEISVAQEGRVYTFAVLDLEANGVSQVEARTLSDRLRHQISEIVTSKQYISSQEKDQYMIFERAQIDMIFEQFEIQNIGCVSDSCAIEFGKMLQVDRVVIGRVSRIGNTYSISARIIDVETAKTINSSYRDYKGTIDGMLSSSIIEISYELMGVKRKKSRKKWYLLAGATVVGVGTVMALKENVDNDKFGMIIIDIPWPE